MKLVSKKKKNNKGFSLVELIVVVLIIAIIAVALAPQVMKWVGTARTSVEENNSATIKSAAMTAYAEFVSKGYKVTSTETITVDNSLDSASDSTKIVYYLKEVLNGEYPTTNAGGTFSITITADGKVTVNP